MKIEPIGAHLSSQIAKVYVSWGIFHEYCVEQVETTKFPEISEVDLDKMKEGYQNKNTK